MFKLIRWGCVLITVGASTISVSAAPQVSSARHEVRSVRPILEPSSKALSQQSITKDESAKTKLPVRRVVLYKTGIGYFEHVGRIEGDQAVRIDFTSGQLNDVLQSLTILDLNGGRIAGVNYNSEAPLSQRLGTLHLPLEETTDLFKFYAALRGARLEITNRANTFTGRLLSIERKTRLTGGTTVEVDLATLISDSGEVRDIEITPSVTVRLADREVNAEVARYLGLLSSTRQQDIRRMTIDTTGSGNRELYVSYVSEVPVWKTTYRIVLSSKSSDKPLLQGWAVVDNTVGEDWTDVELSLVSGAPQSFIQKLSQPFYTRRPVVALPEMAQFSPQTHESAMMGGLGSLSGNVTDPSGGVIANAQVRIYSDTGGLVASRTTDAAGNYRIDDLPAGNYRAQFSSPGFRNMEVRGLQVVGGSAQNQNIALQVGSATQTITVQALASGVQTENAILGTIGGHLGSARELGHGSDAGFGEARGIAGGVPGGVLGGFVSAAAPSTEVLNAARAASQAAAQGADLGDLFQYKLKDRVTIHKNESALVPILQEHLSAEKVSLWNAALGSPRPLRALWLTNSSNLTLDGGSFSVLENEAFAGEGLTSSIKPGEKRLLSYAADLGAKVQIASAADPQIFTNVRIVRGVMTQTCETREETTYTVRDDDITPRTILIEHPLRPGWLLSEDSPQPDEATSAVYRFRVSVEPKATKTLIVRERKPLETTYELTNLDSDKIALLLRQKSINSEIEAAFRKIVEQKNRVAALEDEISRRDDETKKIYDDQARLRENLKALKGSTEERALTQRYTKQLDDQESSLETLQQESADLQQKHDQAQGELDKMIESLSLDATI